MSKMLKAVQKWPASGRIEEVIWNDHCRGQGWSAPDNYQRETVSMCRTVGYLLSEDAAVVRLLQSHDSSNGNIDGCQVIGKAMIVSRRVLRRR